MKIINLAELPEDDFAELKKDLAKHSTLGKVLTWAVEKPKQDFSPQIITEFITQDEFTHDIIIRYRDLFLVYDTT